MPLAAPLDAPLDPSSDDARRWLADELTSGRYQSQPGLLDRLREWLQQLLESGPSGELPSVVLPIAIGLVLAAVAAVLAVVLRREVGRTGPGDRSGELDVPDVPADTLRRQARDALAAGDWDTAVLDGLRAVARRAVERVVLDDAPGRTAHEVAVALTAPFPDEQPALLAAADAFDAVRYGDRRATEEQARELLGLDDRLGTAGPRRAPAVVETVG
ncbi:DUF4129 domain-containing protein [Phycicoccus sp. CSK15P-2]|uniref:DUF4129 domain-containing protein n=1 Tax=Phycicoccus sp. CSK15P-2 TaxID=2807627 RepID=UPI00194F5B9C|nr:DUF4129 domain-containing protein [Phycicoccus sp. CSK15P-2]MBM6402898.1 DUF4129 domain-containing protein [Phycicoccus sp. CSK15P-2]